MAWHTCPVNSSKCCLTSLFLPNLPPIMAAKDNSGANRPRHRNWGDLTAARSCQRLAAGRLPYFVRRSGFTGSLTHKHHNFFVRLLTCSSHSPAPDLLAATPNARTTASTIETEHARQNSARDVSEPATAPHDEATATTRRAAPHDQHDPQRSDSKRRETC